MGERPDEIDRAGASDAGADTSEIRSEIEQTRAEMSGTIDAIQDRLSPQHLKEQVKEQVREATIGKAEDMIHNAGDTINDARSTLMETIRDNPIPSALVGIGLGWLLLNRRSGGSYPRYSGRGSVRGGYRDQRGYERSYPYAYDQRGSDQGVIERGQHAVGHAASQVQETASNVAGQVQETASNVAGQVQETAGYIADQAQYQAQRVEDRFQQSLHENPLAIGAVALALGTAVGFSLPQTERENELLGEARDNLIDRAQTVAQDTMEKVQRVAGDVIDEAQSTAQQSAREQGLIGEQREAGA